MTDIVVLRSLNMDLSVNVRRMPLPGETISGGDLISNAGAKGAVWASVGLKKAIPARPIEPVDTTGAGDAFIGGFSTAIIEGKSIEEALKSASACGALAATKRGAQSSLPTRQEVVNFIASKNKS